MNSHSHKTTRRNFLAGSTTSAAGAGLTILPSAKTAFAYEANERIRLAVFGNKYNARSILPGCHVYNLEVVAVCDPNRKTIDKAFSQWQETAARMDKSNNPADRPWGDRYRKMAKGEGIKTYSDIRRLFDETADTFDALVIANLDQFHAIGTELALTAGKPVCTERPLGLNITEARKMRALAADAKLPVTYRSPGTGRNEFRRAMELVEDGAIGPVREVHIWFQRGGPDRNALPEGTQPIPNGLDWKSWLGSLPYRDYHKDWMAYAHWRETCNGGLGVFGMHTTIFPFLTLQLNRLWDRPAAEARIRVSAECSRLNRISFPKWERIRWEIPARGENLPPVTITWHHGPEFAPGARELIRKKMRAAGVADDAAADELMGKAGAILVGLDRALVGNDHSVKITALPTEKFAEVETKTPQRIAPTRGIYQDWFNAIRSDGKQEILANFENGAALSELVMLGNIATLYPEETLAYNPTHGRITNKTGANEHL